MKKNQVILLTTVLVVTGGAAVWKYRQRIGAIGTVPREVGSDLLAGFNPADVTSFTVTDSKGEVVLEQKDGKWIVPARDGFPASIDAINALRDNAFALKIAEVQRVGASRHGQLKLLKPGEGGTEEETGTYVNFRDSAGKTVKAFVAGKTLSPDDEQSGMFNMSSGGPKSQYIRVEGIEGQVFKARAGFTRLESDVKNWLDKGTFLKVEKPKSFTVSGKEPAETWTVSRDSEAGTWTLASPAPGEDFDSAKAGLLGSAFSFVQFTDVLPAAEAAKAGLDQPARTAVVNTFDGFEYTIKVGAPDTANGDNRFMTYTVNGKFEETRTPPAPAADGKPAETEEQKKAADEAFAKQLADKKKKLAEEQLGAGRIFSVTKPSLDPILKTRPDFMKDKPADSVIPADAPPVQPKPPVPTAKPRVEAVTPPISIPPAEPTPAPKPDAPVEATTPPVEAGKTPSTPDSPPKEATPSAPATPPPAAPAPAESKPAESKPAETPVPPAPAPQNP